MSLVTGYLLGQIGAAYQNDLRRAGRAAAGIASDAPLIAEIHTLRARLAEVEAAAQANYQSAIAWQRYAESLEAARSGG